MSRSHLTENQLELMDILWRLGEASVQQIHELQSSSREVSPATIATTLNRLRKDGVVERVRIGRQFIYRANMQRSQLQSSMLGRIIESLFDGDSSALLSHLVKAKQISTKDLKEASRLLEEHEKSGE